VVTVDGGSISVEIRVVEAAEERQKLR